MTTIDLQPKREQLLARWNALGRAQEICVEALSPSNAVEEMIEKCALYFEAGAKEV
jgi:hypothetical protein